MDDMTTLTTTKACTRQLLKKPQQWSTLVGNLSEQCFYIIKEPIQVYISVTEKPVKSLEGQYKTTLKDTDQVDQLR